MQGFSTAFDFTVPEQFQPVKENIKDEVIQLDSETVSMIRHLVSGGK